VFAVTVQDRQGNAIANAAVTDEGGVRHHTDEDGRVLLEGDGSGKILLVLARGYQPLRYSPVAANGGRNFLIQLSPVKQAAQPPADTTAIVSDYTKVDHMPEYPGGMAAFYKYFGKAFRLPGEARELGLRGKVVLQFLILADGNVSEVKILKDLGAGTGDEARRVLLEAEKWSPATAGGKAVSVLYMLPVQLTSDKSIAALAAEAWANKTIILNQQEIALSDLQSRLDGKQIRTVAAVSKSRQSDNDTDKRRNDLISIITH
jgi:hypothetical protein